VIANREHPGLEELYRVDVASGAMTRLTENGGLISGYAVSPDEKRLLFLGSKVTQHPELYVVPAGRPGEARRLSDTMSAEFRAIDWALPELVGIPSSHPTGGFEEVWARVYTPAGWSADRRWPAVAFVHGAGYLQNVHHGWSSYYREFMFHTLLVRRGYVVIDIDYRGSSGYGRDWRTAIYRDMGSPEIEDYEDGLRWLVSHRNVDPARVGVYGGSYGGFFTFMAMFKQPELFAAGAALRPVSDWAHYNHGYTSNILNTPQVDPEAYRKSSPIEYAEGLRRPLLILHGMVDDNVVFQDSVRLVQRLIELGKTDWFETAIYPLEPHSFKEPSSWTDEYRRIWNLFERTLWPDASRAP
jgi:dipeptidyl aminopeptidase/acylaminoacyl peptidase